MGGWSDPIDPDVGHGNVPIMITITWVFSIEITPGYIIFSKIVSGICTLTLVSYSVYTNQDE